MLLTRQADIKSYPEEAVAECWKNRNGISRRANRTLLKEGTMAEPRFGTGASRNYTGFTISLRYRTSVIPPVRKRTSENSDFPD